MQYDEMYETLSAHAKAEFEKQGIDASNFQFLDAEDYVGMGLKYGDIARLKKYMRVGKRDRHTNSDDDDDDEARDRRDARKRSNNAARMVAEGILDDPMRVATLLPKNWVSGGVASLAQLWRGQFHGNVHLWEEVAFLGMLVDQLVLLPGLRTSALHTLVWGRLVVWAGKLKGEPDASAVWSQKLVREKESIMLDETKIRLMIDFIGLTNRGKPQQSSHQATPQPQTVQQPNQQQQQTTRRFNFRSRGRGR
jgi:hypothetical protein